MKAKVKNYQSTGALTELKYGTTDSEKSEMVFADIFKYNFKTGSVDGQTQ